MKRIYCDISGTTPIDYKVAEFMHDLQKRIYGNPSSIHREGQAGKAIIEKSRTQIANFLNCMPEEIIFTSSGSESNNMALQGFLNNGDHFITSSYEHPAILKVLPFLESKGIEYTLIKPDNNGIIQPNRIEKKIKPNTKLISIMYVNNEIGTINPINQISLLAKKYNIIFHSDAVQAFGKILIDLKKTPVDLLSISAHKLYGPKGVGSLFIKRGTILKPLIYGGNQEHNLRASTENIAGIGGFGMAVELAAINLDENTQYINRLEKYFINKLDELKIEYKINGSNRIPGVLNITFFNMDGQTFVIQLDMMGVGISFGAACSSGSIQASKILIDIGLSKEDASSTVRISFGKIHSLEDVNKVVKSINEIITKKNRLVTNER